MKLWLAGLLVFGLAAPLQADLQAEEITVFAASSLKTALDHVAADWQAETGHVARVSYDGSAKLAKQIEQGAPVDVFISAAETWMDALEAGGLIEDGTRRDVVGNGLVLIAHGAVAAVPIGPELDLGAMLGDGKLAMGMIASVPAGQYGHEALVSLGLWDSVAGRVVETDTVRAAVKLVALGEAAYGIVFASDAVGEAGISVVGAFADTSHARVVYPAAVTVGGKAVAGDFVDYLTSPAAQARFGAQGFRVEGFGVR